MPTYTSNYSIPKPTNNGDATTWGTYLNSGMDIIDSTVKSVSTVANAALPLAGGTLTGGLTGTSASFTSTLSVTGVVSYAARQTATILASTVAGDYLQLLPTDLGVGKAGFYIAKSATPGTWNFNFYDGATNSGTLQVNSVAAGFSGNVSVSGTLGVTGISTLPNIVNGTMYSGSNGGGVSIGGGSTYNNGGGIQVYGSTASGASGVIIFSTGTGATNSQVGSFAANGTFNVSNNATIGGTLGVAGAATFSSSVSAASLAGTALASAAQTLTGSSTTQAITPSGFAGNSSLGTNGYYKLPGGLIIQWGYLASAASTGTAITFPVTFSSVYSIQVTPQYGGTPIASQVFNVTGSGATVYAGVASPISWIAIGS
jgi:hypothetical protein